MNHTAAEKGFYDTSVAVFIDRVILLNLILIAGVMPLFIFCKSIQSVSPYAFVGVTAYLAFAITVCRFIFSRNDG
jgi:hypothetical protein